MKQITAIIILVLISICLYSQSSKGEFMKTKSGLEYKILKEGNGEKPQKGDKVTVNYKGTLEDGTTFDSSYDRGTPFVFTVGVGQVIPGWDEGFLLLSKGAKATLKLKPELAYGNRAIGSIPANSTLIFEIELLSFEKKKEIKPYNFANKTMIEHKSGLKYYIIEEGKGNTPKKGKNVTVNYTGYLEDGSMFDSSVERGTPFSFQLGAGRVISGWDIGVALMKPGAKFRFIIPADLGYGARAIGPIPANSTLIFDVELISYK